MSGCRLSKPMTPQHPVSLLTEYAHLLPSSGAALDLACGKGRNAIFLAQRGLEVTGIDRSEVALAEAREAAEEAGVQVKIKWVAADLEASTVPLPQNHYNVITCFYYRDPNLYPQIFAALRPGGILFYETFTLDQLQHDFGPRDPDHLLAPGELPRVFQRLELLFYREMSLEKAVAGLIARKRNRP